MECNQHTFTDVAAYWKKGNKPDDQSERSRFSPSGCVKHQPKQNQEHENSLLQAQTGYGRKHLALVDVRRSEGQDSSIGLIVSRQLVFEVFL